MPPVSRKKSREDDVLFAAATTSCMEGDGRWMRSILCNLVRMRRRYRTLGRPAAKTVKPFRNRDIIRTMGAQQYAGLASPIRPTPFCSNHGQETRTDGRRVHRTHKWKPRDYGEIASGTVRIGVIHRWCNGINECTKELAGREDPPEAEPLVFVLP